MIDKLYLPNKTCFIHLVCFFSDALIQRQFAQASIVKVIYCILYIQS